MVNEVKLNSEEMVSSIEYLANAVLSSSQRSVWWDIVLPVAIAILIALITSVLTYCITRRLNNKMLGAQESQHRQKMLVERENQNIEAINEVMLLAHSCLTSLLALKDNYRGRLTEKISHRLLEVPVMKAAQLEPVSFDVVNRLLFLTPSQGEEVKPWSQVTVISNVFFNYNAVMEMWRERNQLREHYQSVINGSPNITDCYDLSKICKEISAVNLQQFIQISEHCITLTDCLCLKLIDFLKNFEDCFSVKLNRELDKRLLIKYVTFSCGSYEHWHELSSPGATPNYSELRPFFQSDEEFRELVQIFQTSC